MAYQLIIMTYSACVVDKTESVDGKRSIALCLPTSTAFKMRVVAAVLIELLEERHIGGVSRTQAFFIQHCQDSLVAFLNEIADDGVVEVIHIDPLDAFRDVFFLFFSQCELNEELLQLLIAVVDDKLLKAIGLQSHKLECEGLSKKKCSHQKFQIHKCRGPPLISSFPEFSPIKN
jgi:hypothetical protein